MGSVMAVLIGTSGWQYRHWKGRLYPARLAQRAWLEHYAARFATVEVNATFYRQQSEETFRRWAAETPRDFRFAIKGHRFITHYKRLREVAESVERLRRPARGLGDKLDAVVWQLPADFRCDLDRLGSFLAELKGWPEVRHALELRHRSWFTPAVAERLGEARVWAADIRRWRAEGRTVHCYFDNDAEGAAPRDALRLIELVGREPAVTIESWRATARS